MGFVFNVADDRCAHCCFTRIGHRLLRLFRVDQVVLSRSVSVNVDSDWKPILEKFLFAVLDEN
jgi:hypothetical protein